MLRSSRSILSRMSILSKMSRLSGLCVVLATAGCGPRVAVDDTAERVQVPVAAPARSTILREVDLRLAEWGLDTSARWRVESDDTIALCWHPPYDDEPCEDESRFERFATLAEAIEAIDAQGLPGANTLTFEEVIWGGGGWRQVREPLRGIDKLFWALALADVHAHWFTADEYPEPLSERDEIEAHLDWLAGRYGLERKGAFLLDLRQPEHEREDISFGTFVGEDGVPWTCTRDVSSSMTCCGVSCSSAHDGLHEPH